MKGAIASGVRRFYEFGLFRLDPIRRRLSRDGKFVPLYPKAVEALIILVEHSGEILERDALMSALWPGTIVEESNLTVAVSHLRKVLNGNGDDAEFIQTIPRVGYRFVADVREIAEEPAPLIAKGSRSHESVEIGDVAENGTGVSEEQSPRQPAIVAPTQIKRQSRAKTAWLLGSLIVTIVVAFAALFLVRYRAALNSSRTNVPQGRGYSNYQTMPIPEKSIAVLPFENLSDDEQNAYFAAGVQDEIISDLAKITDLKVVSRTSANLYKSGNPRNSREIGQQLDVAHLLEGSVQRIGNRLRVHAQLIDTRTDAHSWAQTYDRDVADLFAVQSEISQAIADQLHAQISTDVRLAIQRAPTLDLTAFELYTRAKNLLLSAPFSNTRKNDLLQAVALLDEAVVHDPRFFQAYCLLAYAHDLLYFSGHDHTPARLTLAESAIQAASRLRPDAGEAHLAQAQNLYWGYLDYHGALAQLEVGAESLPNDPRVFELKAYIERRQGHWEESIRNLGRAADLDPRNVRTLQQIAAGYDALRRYAEEQSVLDHALAVDPNDPDTRVARALVEFDSKADTQPLQRLLDEIRAKEPAAIQRVADALLICALAQRSGSAAADALAALGENGFSNQTVKFSPRFIQGLIARMMKDDGKARAAFTKARIEQERIVQFQPNYGPALCVLGLIDAALGRKEEALREGRQAVELLPVEKDSINGPLMIKYLAMIAAWVGDKDLACEQLAAAARIPGPLSYGELKLLPLWDPLRGDPRFEKIVVSLAPKHN